MGGGIGFGFTLTESKNSYELADTKIPATHVLEDEHGVLRWAGSWLCGSAEVEPHMVQLMHRQLSVCFCSCCSCCWCLCCHVSFLFFSGGGGKLRAIMRSLCLPPHTPQKPAAACSILCIQPSTSIWCCNQLFQACYKLYGCGYIYTDHPYIYIYIYMTHRHLLYVGVFHTHVVLCCFFLAKRRYGTSKNETPKPERNTWKTIRDILTSE